MIISYNHKLVIKALIYFLYLVKFKMLCIFYIYSASQFRQAIFHAFNKPHVASVAAEVLGKGQFHMHTVLLY